MSLGNHAANIKNSVTFMFLVKIVRYKALNASDTCLWITSEEGCHAMLFYGTPRIEGSVDKSISHMADSVRPLYRFSLLTQRKIY